MEPLLPAFRRELRARAHHLHPVVLIGHHGLTRAVLHEIDVALSAHELIKVRVASDDRDEREALLGHICAELDCGAVQQIGKLLVLWRPSPEAGPKPKPSRRPRAAAHSTAPAGRRRPFAAAVTAAEPAARVRTARRSTVAKAPSGVPRAASPRRRRGF